MEANEKAKLIEKNVYEMENDRFGEVSDGYHTFNELYHHRTILMLGLCLEYQTVSWKSKLHHDGTMYPGYFIVGIHTPYGDATYHVEERYWDMFKIDTLPKAPSFDGHTPDEAIERIAKFVLELNS